MRWTVAALVLYGIVLAVTFGIHIPLNDEIDQAGDPDRIADLAHVRNQFEGPWVAGTSCAPCSPPRRSPPSPGPSSCNQFEGPWVAANIVRTLLSTAAVAALARALFLHGRSTADRTPGASTGEPA